ncbi:hypothetical protein AQS8620_01608 [Aquimixticola soesokkakensis]|uniref:Uncharacterized protein n=1 Tax=Aquimixticola soesokkakensis TaxID=1519096 RepID=A0A1Y5SIN7_9RHOB|nr:hypothetical protein [Aquimixticola soesokkakensis]SLN41582.1 hypothetical protein AQS8620_01608 [Aquimixticola soesokkakensis]
MDQQKQNFQDRLLRTGKTVTGPALSTSTLASERNKRISTLMTATPKGKSSPAQRSFAKALSVLGLGLALGMSVGLGWTQQMPLSDLLSNVKQVAARF